MNVERCEVSIGFVEVLRVSKTVGQVPYRAVHPTQDPALAEIRTFPANTSGETRIICAAWLEDSKCL